MFCLVFVGGGGGGDIFGQIAVYCTNLMKLQTVYTTNGGDLLLERESRIKTDTKVANYVGKFDVRTPRFMDSESQSWESSLKQTRSSPFYHCLNAVDYLSSKLLHQAHETDLNEWFQEFEKRCQICTAGCHQRNCDVKESDGIQFQKQDECNGQKNIYLKMRKCSLDCIFNL